MWVCFEFLISYFQTLSLRVLLLVVLFNIKFKYLTPDFVENIQLWPNLFFSLVTFLVFSFPAGSRLVLCQGFGYLALGLRVHSILVLVPAFMVVKTIQSCNLERGKLSKISLHNLINKCQCHNILGLLKNRHMKSYYCTYAVRQSFIIKIKFK